MACFTFSNWGEGRVSLRKTFTEENANFCTTFLRKKQHFARRRDKLLKDKLLKDKVRKDKLLKRQTSERQTPDETNS